MSEAFLQAEVTRLHAELAAANAESKKRRIQIKPLNEELAKLRKDVQDLGADRDGWKQKATAAPGELQTKLDQAVADLLSRDHRDAFAALRDDTEVGLDPAVKVETLWNVLGYRPEGVPDPAKIKALVVSALDGEHGYFRAKGETPNAAPGGATTPAERPPLVVQQPASRGARDTVGSLVKVRKADMQDPKWCLNPRNAALLAEADKAGTLQVVD